MKLEVLEAYRGTIAAWLLIGFGFTYFYLGNSPEAIRNKKHSHVHIHGDGVVHDHQHSHTAEHAHVHDQKSSAKDITALDLIYNFRPWPL